MKKATVNVTIYWKSRWGTDKPLTVIENVVSSALSRGEHFFTFLTDQGVQHTIPAFDIEAIVETGHDMTAGGPHTPPELFLDRQV